MKKITLILNTVKYLKVKQVFYRLIYFLKSKLSKKKYQSDLKDFIEPIKWNNSIHKPTSYFGDFNFNFLNIKKNLMIRLIGMRKNMGNCGHTT